MLAIFATTVDQAQTLQSSVDALSALKLALTIMFGLTALIGILNLVFYLMIKHSPDLTFHFLIPKIYLGKKKVRFTVEDNLGRPLSYTRLTIFKNEKISKDFYFQRSKYSVYLPHGVYQATVSKFGHTAATTDTFTVDDDILDFDLSLNQTQEARPAKTIATLGQSAMIANALLALAWIVAFWRAYTSLKLPLQIVAIALITFSTYLAIRLFDLIKGVQLLNFKNRPLINKKVEITNKFGEPIEQLMTNEKGLLHLMISPGIYKFTPEDHIHRTVRVNETSLGHLTIKF